MFLYRLNALDVMLQYWLKDMLHEIAEDKCEIKFMSVTNCQLYPKRIDLRIEFDEKGRFPHHEILLNSEEAQLLSKLIAGFLRDHVSDLETGVDFSNYKKSDLHTTGRE